MGRKPVVFKKGISVRGGPVDGGKVLSDYIAEKMSEALMKSASSTMLFGKSVSAMGSGFRVYSHPLRRASFPFGTVLQRLEDSEMKVMVIRDDGLSDPKGVYLDGGMTNIVVDYWEEVPIEKP